MRYPSDASQVVALQNSLPEDSSSRRVRRDLSLQILGNGTSTTSAPPTPPTGNTIPSPVICATIGEAVLFTVDINHENRSLSSYPQYTKNHLWNSNPDFDYGQFRQLHSVIQKTNMSVRFFANVFDEDGVFVFHDHANPKRETIVRVPKREVSCMGALLDAAQPGHLINNDIGRTPVSTHLL